ncbi:MAG: hypothetical protein ABIJ21_06740 [Nanoarchaeota archaeon]
MGIFPEGDSMKAISLVFGLVIISMFLVACEQNLSGQAAKVAAVKYLNCIDSDGGQNFVVKGRVFGDTNQGPYENWDSCVSQLSVKEWYCQRTTPKYLNYNCQNMGNYVCADGACVINQTPDSCGDSDGGQYPYTFGQVTGYAGGNPYTNPDTCNSPTQVKEWYCSGTAAQYSNMNCNAGDNCQNGVCVVNETNQSNHAPVVTDLRQELGTEWYVYTYTATASDPDPGDQVVRVEFLNNLTGEHYIDTQGPVFTYVWNATGLPEGTVQISARANDGDIWGDWYSESFYFHGGLDQRSCNDSDGNNIYTFGYIWGTLVNGQEFNYNDSCYSSTTVKEWTCNNLTPTGTNVFCGVNYHCDGGRCVQNQAQNNSCTDTDGGYNPPVFGTVYGNYNGYPYAINDSCVTNVTLVEWYCTGTTATSINASCTGNWTGCSGGRCI